MGKIEKKEALHICFTKRRQGIFKKAGELAVLCGAQITVITLSPGGKPFSFGQPSTDAVIARYLDPGRHQVPIPITTSLEIRLRYYLKYCKLGEQSGGGLWWWEAPIDGLDLEELVVMKGAIEELYKAILKKANQPTSAGEAVQGMPQKPSLAMLNGSYHLPVSSVPGSDPAFPI
uniref:Agamous-like MADS-box protein AGL61 n=2 Tax=Elaeis guineensis var. tenera TaxID=51953 RepID=A0A6I9SEU2_ELAGV|nr:agamous-like MADS-box protein AGL61 [Elaeis guineensis]